MHKDKLNLYLQRNNFCWGKKKKGFHRSRTACYIYRKNFAEKQHWSCRAHWTLTLWQASEAATGAGEAGMALWVPWWLFLGANPQVLCICCSGRWGPGPGCAVSSTRGAAGPLPASSCFWVMHEKHNLISIVGHHSKTSKHVFFPRPCAAQMGALCWWGSFNSPG